MIIQKKAYAKINLYLKILDKLPDGYHNIFTVMQKISLYDNITIEIKDIKSANKFSIKIICSDKSIESETNTAYKAAALFLRRSNLPPDIINITDITVEIEKRIPSQAGLGGGSSDAAVVLLSLNEYFNFIFPESELIKLSAAVGADVPFFVKNTSCAVCEGIGDIVAPFTPDISGLSDLPDCEVVIVKPMYNISTKQAFEDFDKAGKLNNLQGNNFDIFNKTELLQNFSVKSIYNDFSNLASSQNKNIVALKHYMKLHGAVAAELTGSGSALFGIFKNTKYAKHCAHALKRLEDVEFCGIYNFI